MERDAHRSGSGSAPDAGGQELGSLTADVTFALVIAACAVSALIIGAKRLPSSSR